MSIPDALIHLLSSVEQGEDTVFAADSPDRVVQAEWIRSLVLGLSWPAEVHEWWKKKDAAHIIPEGGGSVPIGRRGLRIHGAKVIGSLDLSGCGSTQAPLPALTFKSCNFKGDAALYPTIDISNATLCGLNLEDSRFRHLRGVGMTVVGSVNLTGVRAEGDELPCWCNMSLCIIHGDFVADAVEMHAPRRKESDEFHYYPDMDWALNLYGSRIEGAVTIRDPLMLDGGLLMDNSRVGGDITLNGAEITPFPGGPAISMDRARIDGSLKFVILKCRGLLWLNGCEVGGSLDLIGGHILGDCLEGPQISASLYAKGLAVRGWVTLRGFAADRPLCLEDAQVSGNLRVRKVHVLPSVPVAKGPDSIEEGGLVAKGMRVAGSIILDEENKFSGGLNLTDVCCATLQDNSSGYDESRPIRIDGFRYERLGEKISEKTVSDRLNLWLSMGEVPDDYRPQPYVQLAQVLANHGHDHLALDVLARKADLDAKRTWKDITDSNSTDSGLKRLLGNAGRCRRAIYWLCIWPYGMLFRFGLSPSRAVFTVLGFIVFGCAMFGHMDSKKALVVAQTPVTTLVHEDDADPNRYKFASAFVSKAVPKSESESVNGPTSVQSSVSRDLTTPVKDSVPTNKSTPVEGRVSTQKPVIVKGAQPVIKPAPTKEVASIAALEPIQKPVPANASAGKKEQQHSDYSDSDVPCRDSIRLLVYAADVFIPLVDLREEGKCEIDKAKGSEVSDGLITTFRLMKALYAIIGWLVTGAAVVTISGVMRHRLLRD